MTSPRCIWTLAAAAVLACGSAARADDAAAPALTDREQAFVDALSNTVLTGHFTVGQYKPGEELSAERYTIGAVTKAGALWRLDVQMRYGERKVQMPVFVPVRWAGDTPVISLTDMKMPGLGTFTARVVIHDGAYAGTWKHGTGDDAVGGVLFGTIAKQGEAAATQPSP